MSRINHENIDKWLFDFSEGNLNASQKRELSNFLQAHPEYHLDLDSWKNSTVSANEVFVPSDLEADLLALATPTPARRNLTFAALFLLLFTSGGSIYFLQQSSQENTLAQQNGKEVFHALDAYRTADLAQHIQYQASIAKASEGGNTTTSTQGTSVSQDVVSNQNATKNNTSTFVKSQAVNQSAYETQNNGLGVNQNQIADNEQEANLPLVENKATSGKTEESISSIHLPLLLHAFNTENDKTTAQLQSQGGAFGTTANLKDNSGNTEFASTTDENDGNGEVNGDAQRRKTKKFHVQKGTTYNTRDHQILMPDNNNVFNYASFAASAVTPSLSMNYRNQFTGGQPGAHVSRIAYTQFFKKLGGALGFGYTNITHAEGWFSSNQYSLFYSPKFKLSRYVTLEPGLNATYYDNHLNGAARNQPVYLEPVTGLTGISNKNIPEVSGFDLSLSGLLNTRHFYIAGAVDHLVRPQYNISNSEIPLNTLQPMRFKLTAGFDAKRQTGSAWSFSPQFSMVRSGQISQFWAGSLVRYNKLTMGASVAQTGEFMATAGIHAGKFRFNYNFDVSKSYLNGNYYGSHEISLRISLAGLTHDRDQPLIQ
jgi:type IX secretion system PorP/SprF family membrane protein